MRPPLARCARLLILLAGLALAVPHAAHAAAAPAATRAAGEALAAAPTGSERDAKLSDWARRATLDDLLFVLRRDPAQLGRPERALVAAAISRTSAARAELRHRLELRALMLDPGQARKSGRDAAELELLRPRASVFRVGALLPDRGDYAAYGDAVATALAAGLAWGRGPAALPIDVDRRGTGDNESALAAAVLDTASRACGVIVGELLSAPTYALATGTRLLGLPLVSPTATDEAIGRTGNAVFAIGPSSEERGRTLARAVLDGRPRKLAILTSSASASNPFVRAFTAEAESLGAKLVRRDTYAPGNTDFKIASRSMKTFGAEILFWDGESREADALVRQLAADGIALKLCGSSDLSPEHMHSSVRSLLDGVRWVADDWKLPAAQQAVLDSLARARSDRAGSVWVRGFLAGRRIAAAVDAGARTPAELAARLRHRDGARRAAGFLECTLDGATLPVYVVARGKSIEPQQP